MKEKPQPNLVFIGKNNKYCKTVTNLDLNLKLINATTFLQGKTHVESEDGVLCIIDIANDHDLSQALILVNERNKSHFSALFLVNNKCDITELLSLCQSGGNIDCLIKPIIKDLLISRVKHLLNEISLQMALDHEIAERENLRTSLLDEERYAESLINSSMDMIISVDLNRNIFEFNKRAQETFGYSKEEIIGKPVDLLYADKNQSLSVYQHTLEEHQYSAEITNCRKNGELFPSLISASILVERGGKTLGLMGISRDISDFKRVEADLKRAKEDAEAANKAKSEFLAHMSHEIRTPMTSIIGYAELLEDGLIGKHELLEFVRSVKRNAQHLLHLINEILDLSQVEKGKLTLHHAYCSPQNIITNLYHITKAKSKEKGLSVEVKYVGKMPKFIYSDPTRILQCLVNLVGNAIKFTAKDGNVCVSIECFHKNAEPLLCFKVADTGIGIPSDQLKLILEPFEQGNISKDASSKGVGLGLAITNRLANLLGGTLTVESEHGIGSTFTLTIKCGMSTQELELTEADQTRLVSSEFKADILERDHALSMDLDGKILLAEDNLDISKLVTKILEDAGAVVDAVDAGTYVLEKVSEEQYDLIFMDMQLPLMDGMTVVKKLRADGYQKPIIALTASAMHDSLIAFTKIGCNDCAIKPIGRYELIKLAYKWLKYGDREHKRSDPQIKSMKAKKAKASMDTTNNGRGYAVKEDHSHGALKNLIYSSYHNDPDMHEIVRDYVNTLPVKLNNLTHAIERNDLHSLRKIVHGLHGSGGGFGFDILSKYGGEIEKMVDQGCANELIENMLHELQDVIDRIMSAYKS